MDTNRANLEVLFQNFSVAWSDGFNAEKEKSIYEKIATVVPSTGSSTLHAWLNQIPRMREWLGPRFVNNITSNSITIVNRKFENTIELERTEIEDDQYGLYIPVAGYAGADAAANPDRLLLTALTANGTWGGDGAAFFGTTRTYGSNTISNYTTSALSQTTFETAMITMQSYLGHNDDPLMVEPTILLVGPKLYPTAWDILKNPNSGVVTTGTTADRIAGANRNLNSVELVMSKRLTGAYDDYWFLFGQTAGIRGLVYQDRMKAEFQAARMDVNGEFVFKEDKFQMGTRARGEGFLALPHLIYAAYL